MAFNLDVQYPTESEKYDFFKRVINAAAQSKDYKAPEIDPSDNTKLIRKRGYDFDEEPGHVNLLAVRGLKKGRVEEDDVSEFDDMIYVIYKDKESGEKRVKEYVSATDTYQLVRADEDGNPTRRASAYIVFGQHKYQLGRHSKDDPHRSLTEAHGSDFDSSSVEYRALMPHDNVVCLRDYSGNRELDPEEKRREIKTGDYEGKQQYGESETEAYELLPDINIHHSIFDKRSYSDGCQTIPDWEVYKDFIKHVEKDLTIKSWSNTKRELLPEGWEEHWSGSEKSKERSVIYTLVPGAFLEEVAEGSPGTLSFPIDLGKGREVHAATISHYFEATEQTFAGGYFPIGANTVWHGGVHLQVPAGNEVRACLDGRIVAARLTDFDAYGTAEAYYEDKSLHYGSHDFILLEHTWQEKTFFSLYMHLNPLSIVAEMLTGLGISWINTQEETTYVVSEGQSVEYRNVPGVSDIPEKYQDKEVQTGKLEPGETVTFIKNEDDAAGDTWLHVLLPESAALDKGYIYKGRVRDGKLEQSTQRKTDEELIEKLQGDGVVALDIPVKGGDLLWRSGEHGSEDYRTGLLHWEIFSEENLFPSEEGAEERSNGTAAEPEPLPDNPAYVTRVTGPESALIGEQITYKAWLNKSNPTLAEKANISWKVWCVDPGTTPLSDKETEEERRAWWNNQEHEVKEKHGVELTVEITQEMGGKHLIARPYRSYIEPGEIEVITLIYRLEKIQWKTVKDTNDNNYSMDSAAILELFKESQDDGWFDSDEVLEIEELKRFYADEDKAKTLRRYACKFVNEWGIPDVEAAVDDLKGRWVTWHLAERIKPYLWWKEAKDAGVNLPASPHVWHYNPITVMQALWVGLGGKKNGEGKGKYDGVSDKEEFNTMVATIHGEAANSSDIAWKAIAHVIMNRVGYREWKKHNTPKEVIKNTGFDAYTHKNKPYNTAYNYLTGDSTKGKDTVERMKEVVKPIYLEKEEDITDNAVLYYSPNAQKALHKKDPDRWADKPKWKFDLLKEVDIDGLKDTDDFKFYKYK